MTAEQLNIKIKLDISDVTQGAKKVKQSLSGMSDKVKQSLPKITTESKNARNALNKIGEASKTVKRHIEDIGKEAKESFSSVTSQSKKMASALANVKSMTGTGTLGIDGDAIEDSADGANSALEGLQGTMQDIAHLNIFSVVSNGFKDIKDSIKPVKVSFKDLKETLKGHKEIMSFLKKYKSEIKNVKKEKFFDPQQLKDAENALKNTTKSVKRLRKEILKAFVEDIKPAIANIAKIALKVGLIASAIGAVAMVINGFSVSKLGDEIDKSSQKAGMSAQKYQEWSYVLQRCGIEASELTQFTKNLNKAQVNALKGEEEVVKAFNKLGMSLEEVKSLSQEQLFEKTVKNLQNVRDTTTRTAIALKLFEEDATKLNTVLRLSNQETSQLISTYNQLGGVMSKELITYSYTLQDSLTNLRSAWQGLRNTLAEMVLPTIIKVVNWMVKAIAIVNMFIRTLFGITSTPSLDSGFESAADSVGGYTDAVDAATGAVEKLKRTTMGFDELNIVGNPNSSSGGGADTGAGGGIDYTGLENSTIPKIDFDSMGLDKWQAKIDSFLDKWGDKIKMIGALLAGLGITSLLEHLGKAIGLGDKFLTVMKTIKKLATTAIVIVLQYSLMSEWLKSYIDGNGFKEYLKAALVGAIGTGILYSMWDSAGLVIGLSVTALASLKTVLDNGGITNVQSAVVALTGLAAAIGAVGVAWTKLGLKEAIAGIGTAITGGIGFIKSYIAAVKVASSEVGLFAAMFPKLSTAIAGIVPGIKGAFSGLATALASVASSIGAVFGLSGTAAIVAGAGVIVAAITGIVSVVTFLKRNWEEVGIAFKNFFNENIVPKLESIRESLGKLRDALAKLIPDSLKQVLKDIANAIGEVVKKIAEWFKSVDWIKAIGKVFEAVGGIIFSVVTGPIAGAINALVNLIDGLVTVITGIVEIVSGVFEAIIGIFTLDGEKIKSGASSIVQGVCDVFGGLWKGVVGSIKEFFSGVINWFKKLWDELVGHSIVPDTINAIIKWFAELPKKILEPLKTFVGNVLKTFQNLWTNIKSWFSSNVAKYFTKEYWAGKFETIRAGASEKLEAVKTEISNKWNAIKSWFSTNVAPKFTREYWSGKFETIKTSASTKLEEVKSTISTKWNSIKSWFSSNIAPKFTTAYWTEKFSSIKNGAKAAFNGVISVVESAVNGIIRKINTLHWTIPDWVPIFGGDSFGFNFRTISIPRLATGGIATSSTLANIGERGAEAILPLTGPQGMAWINKLADAITSRNNNTNNTPVRIVLQVGETELGYACIDSINNITKQTGGLKLHIV